MAGNVANLKLIFRALRYRNYRLFFGGQSISLVGTWMQRIALSWLVYRLTNSALALGVVGFAGQIPTFLLAPIAGVIADRSDRRRILVVTQALAMVQALVIAFLVIADVVAVWHIIFLAILLGLVNAFGIPARQSFVVEMIEKREDLGNAIALNSSMVNGARLLGPSIAGVLIAVAGEGICFVLNGISYIAVIAALQAMRITPRRREPRNTHVLRELKEGLSYGFGSPPIRSVILLLALVSLVGMPYQVLVPILAKEVLHGGPDTVGYLMGATGLGAMAGAIYLASRKSAVGLGKIIPLAGGVFGVGLIALSLSCVLLFSLLSMLLTGFGMMVQMASSNTTLQTIVHDDKRGRVMAFYAMAFMGMAPFGSLFAGGLAHKIGAQNTFLVGGISCILGALVFARKLPSLKAPVYPIYAGEGPLLHPDVGNPDSHKTAGAAGQTWPPNPLVSLSRGGTNPSPPGEPKGR